MCGITGIFDFESKYKIEEHVIAAMANAIKHRGPDEYSCLIDGNLGFGFQRLSIIDISNGHQPFFNDDRSVILICNGEIYNFKELRKSLTDKGHKFKTNCDVEVILHSYVEYGVDFINQLNGQFAFALFDKKKDLLFLARDHFGICPLFYTVVDEVFIFGSEIKSILKHPLVKRSVNLTGLDQVFSFPGLVSPATMFENIKSLKAGHFLLIKDKQVQCKEYWDIDYPPASHDYGNHSESYYKDKLEELLIKSVKYRLEADVPIGFYLSGGIDSSLIAALIKKINPMQSYDSFSVSFPQSIDKEHDESYYQKIMARSVGSANHQIEFKSNDVERLLRDAVYHSECPLKETYNTCSLALSKSVKEENIKVVLSGEGSDEFLGGYVGYRLDLQRDQSKEDRTIEYLLEEQNRVKLWGDADFFYEYNHYEYNQVKNDLYSDQVKNKYSQFDCIQNLGINKERLSGRHVFHKRSYLDFKLRLSDHLISDHCDRVTYANSIEGRYPFLDIELIEFIKTIPPEIKIKGMVEKYILKEVAKKYLPAEVTNRQKFSFVAPDSTQLIRSNNPWIEDLLSYETIKRQGFFNPDVVERLKKMYRNEKFKLNSPFDTDFLIVIITFGIFLELFEISDL